MSTHRHREGDVKDGAALIGRALAETQPEVVVHMAAQPLVLASYADPRGTFDDNVMGTVSLLDALRRAPFGAGRRGGDQRQSLPQRGMGLGLPGK